VRTARRGQTPHPETGATKTCSIEKGYRPIDVVAGVGVGVIVGVIVNLDDRL
jgi:hypothetical protein